MASMAGGRAMVQPGQATETPSPQKDRDNRMQPNVVRSCSRRFVETDAQDTALVELDAWILVLQNVAHPRIKPIDPGPKFARELTNIRVSKKPFSITVIENLE
jgi:hypothetical protein